MVCIVSTCAASAAQLPSARPTSRPVAPVPPPLTTLKTLAGQPVGWLFHLPGIGGHMRIDRTLTAGLLDAGVPGSETQIYDWTGVDRGLIALGNPKRHAEQSKIVADLLLTHIRAHPNEHVTFTSHSAGTGIAVWALEQLPDTVQVDDFVMIASALSPDYDLSKALRHVRHRAYAFNSLFDTVVLSVGTRLFGTVDRIPSDSAGLGGFTAPAGADMSEYSKLTQLPYDDDWSRFGDDGQHIGAMTREFACEVIGPVLLGKGVPHRAATEPSSASGR